jgi:hypothetical protein
MTMSESLVQVFGDVAVILTPIIGAAITALAGFIAKLIHEKAKNQLVQTALTKLNHAVWTVVLEVEETMAKEFKKAAADGKLTDEEKQKLKDAAADKLKNYLSFGELSRIFGFGGSEKAAEFVASKVEAVINERKTNGGATPVNPS